jgi:hypothetical protein
MFHSCHFLYVPCREIAIEGIRKIKHCTQQQQRQVQGVHCSKIELVSAQYTCTCTCNRKKRKQPYKGPIWRRTAGQVRHVPNLPGREITIESTSIVKHCTTAATKKSPRIKMELVLPQKEEGKKRRVRTSQHGRHFPDLPGGEITIEGNSILKHCIARQQRKVQ